MYMYVFTQTLYQRQDMIEVQFLRGKASLNKELSFS